MTHHRILTLGLASLLVIATSALCDEKSKSKKSDSVPEELIGGYTIVSGEKYGEKEATERIEGTTVRIAEDAIVVLDKDKKEVYAQTFKIDTKSTPWKITMKTKITPYKKDGEDKKDKKESEEESVSHGLIEKDGDTVKLIYALPGTPEPTEFKTKEKQLMFVLKNEKKEKKK